MVARLIDHDVPTGDEEQPFTALEKKAARIRQRRLLLESAQARRGQQQGFDHGSSKT
jgi:hypothetical protein